MYTATYDQQLSAIHEAMQTIARHWNSHERRDLRLSAVRFLIWRYLTGMHAGTAAEQVQQTILRSLYEMSFPREEYETHSAVRARCWLIVEMCENAQQLYRKERDELQRSSRANLSSMWADALPDDDGDQPTDQAPDTFDDIEF